MEDEASRIEADDKARRLARDLLLFHRGDDLAPEAPALAEARALFVERVAPALHPVFDEVVAARRAGVSGPSSGRLGRVLMGVLVVGFLGLLGGSAWLAQKYVISPGEDINVAVLDSWVAELRAGRIALPPSRGPTTAAAVDALASSRSHRITHTRGGYDVEGGTTCFDLTAVGPEGSTALVVRVSNDPAPPRVTHAGLAGACRCGRNGRINGCD